MNQSLILVFILLATLSVVNALPHQLSKRETQWGKCSDSNEYLLLGVTSRSRTWGNPDSNPLYAFSTPVLTQFGGESEESYPIASYTIASYPIASYPTASYPIAISSYPIAE
ncbi:hypothetical protein Glove_299g42 [Diversispora epigaea]|uniref:Uncharacterized protein n=1 Tax=Diversispora epigaea TaxID=1348612 RepID=A0A397HX33_9GLOM|nr:hypothetical protein Glove_299g42 [Diversispora epigaea]